jgi:hypothetical protein
LAYVPNQIRHIAIEELLILGTGLGKMKHNRNINQSKQSPVKGFGNQNQTNKASHRLSHILSNTLWAYSRKHHKSTTSTRKTLIFLIRWLKNNTNTLLQQSTHR